MSETTTPAAAEVPAWLTRAELLTIDWCQQRLYARLIDAWTAAILPHGAPSAARGGDRALRGGAPRPRSAVARDRSAAGDP